MRRSIASVLLMGVLLAVAVPAVAWGSLGHRLVAALAWDELNPRARAEIRVLLVGESDPTLPGIASWADELRANDPDLGKRSAPWHYVNIAEHDCRYDAALACRGGDCVVEAIRAQTAILADRGNSRAARLQALKFVVHFVGDVHQPMHAGYAHDKGGNEVQVNLAGAGANGQGWGGNLHSLWDSRMLATTGLDEAGYLHRLRAMPVGVSTSASPAQWAEASCRIMLRPGLYPPRPGIDQSYVQAWLPVAETRLRRGGSALGALLNDALGGDRAGG